MATDNAVVAEGVSAAPEVKAATPPTETPKAPESLVSAAQSTFEIADLKLPDGFDNKAQLESYGSLATELKLSPEQGQKLFDYGAKLLADQNAATQTMLNEIQAKWVGEIKADKTYGGDKLDPTLAKISRFLDRHGDPGLRDALNLTGAGNHPAVYRTLARLADAFTEGTHVSGKPAAGKPSFAETFFNNSPTMKGPN